jgi:uncharacterized membrane protein
MVKRIHNAFTAISDFLWVLFLNGLLTILPIVLTVTLFNFILKILTGWLEPIRRWFIALSEKVPTIKPVIHFLFTTIPYFELIIALCIIIIIGIVVRVFILRTLWHALEQFFLKIPIIRTVYSGVRQMTMAFDPHNQSFQKVVIIEYPRQGIYSIGFLSGDILPELAPEPHTSFVGIYVPTTPNPTHGVYIMVPQQDVMISDLTRQEATAIIISGGIIQPARFTRK